jgi:hypothetical protein
LLLLVGAARARVLLECACAATAGAAHATHLRQGHRRDLYAVGRHGSHTHTHTRWVLLPPPRARARRVGCCGRAHPARRLEVELVRALSLSLACLSLVLSVNGGLPPFPEWGASLFKERAGASARAFVCFGVRACVQGARKSCGVLFARCVFFNTRTTSGRQAKKGAAPHFEFFFVGSGGKRSQEPLSI